MKRKRIMIAAPKSGSGKTLITCALLLALQKNGWRPVSYKCGPDYIDPMFHEKVIGIPSKNLDTFFTGEEQTRKLFVESVMGSKSGRKESSMGESAFGKSGAERETFAVIEGVMGLYDGLGGIREEGSSYHLAKVTKTPIVLVVDAKGMGRSVISLLAGFLAYDKEQLIRGVILNRISKGYYERIKPLIEEELNLCVAGFLPEKEEFHIGSRHLGLVLPDEMK
ncbi:MAG: AAA family ATPase, partial [Lachnospiraceae bacterium]|nr:AAA family ATPase [Lachnospiraceae bacterium]